MAWLHGGNDPYLTYHGFDEDCRPLGNPEADPSPPAYPQRVKTFLYACALWAEERADNRLKAQLKAAGAKI